MHRGFADELVAALGENDVRIGGTLGIFGNDRAKLLLDMRAQGRSDINLLSGDLVEHLFSFFYNDKTRRVPKPALHSRHHLIEIWQISSLTRAAARNAGSSGQQTAFSKCHTSFEATEAGLVN